jgi:hypothetical protein
MYLLVVATYRITVTPPPFFFVPQYAEVGRLISQLSRSTLFNRRV